MKVSMLGLLIPDEALIFILMATGLALLLGAKKLAATLMVLSLTILFVPILAEAILPLLPVWMVVFLVVAIVVSLVMSIVTLLFGRNTLRVIFAHWKAKLIARSIVGLVRLPLRLIRSVFRGIYKGVKHVHTP